MDGRPCSGPCLQYISFNDSQFKGVRDAAKGDHKKEMSRRHPPFVNGYDVMMQSEVARQKKVTTSRPVTSFQRGLEWQKK